MQITTYLLYLCIGVLGIATLQVTANAVKCEKTYRKVGCLAVGATEILVNDRIEGSGHAIDWENIVAYLHSLACRCAEKAKEASFSHFGIRFYGECYGLDEADVKDGTSSTSCFQSQSYGPCDDSNEEECGGADDEYVFELLPTKVNGGYGAWEPFGVCSKSCGGGIQSRTRECDHPKPENGGENCKGPLAETQKCNMEQCLAVTSSKPTNGGYGGWGHYSSCSKTCGTGRKTRTRKCDNPTPANGGKGCKGIAKQSRRCRVKKCKRKKTKIHRQFICEGKKETIKCQNGEKIKIRFANYGRLGRRKCRNGGKHKVCRSLASNEKVENLCNGKKTCSLKASDSVFGKSCAGINSYLKVAWICV